MQIGTIREQIALAVRTAITTSTPATRLECYGCMPLNIVPPAFCVAGVELDPHFTARARDAAFVETYVFTSTDDDKEGQALLDRYLSKTGDESVRAALRDPTVAGRGAGTALGGYADALTIKRVQGYRLYPVSETMLFGAQIVLYVIGSDS